MVGHEGPDRGVRLARRQARRRVIDGFIEAVGARSPLRGQPLQVLTGRVRGDHKRKRRSVGGDHHILGQSALQAQAGNAESPVLVVEIGVRAVVSKRVCI